MKGPHKTTTIHAKSKDGSVQAVAIKDLHVVISAHEGIWFAQGMEIDYAAQGTSLAKVKKAFETGLTMTIGAHLQIFGNVEKLLQPAHEDAWEIYYRAKSCEEYSQLSVHIQKAVGFGKIEYLKEAA